MKLRISIFIHFISFLVSPAFGQFSNYNYKRPLSEITAPWHSITLPDEIYSKTLPDLGDIRIFGITHDSDTIEAPYLLRSGSPTIAEKLVAFSTFNAVQNDKGFFYTFEIPAAQAVSQIDLDFKKENFDWLIKLEGSQDQSEWFTIIQEYRVLSIRNQLTNFKFTRLSFPNSDYRFFRILINSKSNPELTSASIAQRDIRTSELRNYAITTFNARQDAKRKETEIDLELELPVPVNFIKIFVADTFDYQRPLTIEYLLDSFKTAIGWEYNYRGLTTGFLNSADTNGFTFPGGIAKKLKIHIYNQDSEPLAIDHIEVKGYVHELVARFTKPATYFLVYGNTQAARPDYDVKEFISKIPDTLAELKVGAEEKIDKPGQQASEPLFKNKLWLWLIMGVIITLLGAFSISMMKRK